MRDFEVTKLVMDRDAAGIVQVELELTPITALDKTMYDTRLPQDRVITIGGLPPGTATNYPVGTRLTLTATKL